METDIPPDKSIMLTGWARRLKGRSEIEICTEGLGDDGKR